MAKKSKRTASAKREAKKAKVTKGAKAAKSSRGTAAAKRASDTATRSSRAQKPGPRSQALPGMEKVRNVQLDNLCESIAEERGRINDATAEVKGLATSALRIMRAKKLTSHRYAGVELARVPGEEKLRIRTTKNADATAAVETEDVVETEEVDEDLTGDAERYENTGDAKADIEQTELQGE